MNFICTVFEQDDEMLTLLSMVECIPHNHDVKVQEVSQSLRGTGSITIIKRFQEVSQS